MKSNHTRDRRSLILALVITLGATTMLSAQTRSAITGTVRDGSGGVMPGVTIGVSSPNLVGGAQTTQTNADGVYRLPELAAGEYELTAELAGFSTVKRTGIRLATSGTTTVDVTLEVASLRETVVVSGTPTVDVTSATTAATLDKELLQNIPTSTDRRLVTNLINLIPGAYGRTALGAARDDNATMTEGVSVVHPERGQIVGSYGIAQYWLQEVEFVAVGANAEFGEFSGNATNFRLLSGSNRFSGLFQHSRAVPRWTADNRDSEITRRRFSRPETKEDSEYSAQVGGPIKKERVFFFGGANYVKKLVPSLNPERSVGDERFRRFVGKVNWAATQKVRLEAFVLPDHITNTGGNDQTPLNVLQRPETALDYSRPTVTYSERLTWTPTNKTLLEVRQGGMIFHADKLPSAPGSRSGPAPHIDTFTGVTSVNLQDFEVNDAGNVIVAGTLTRFVDELWGGAHDFKLGLEFQRDTQWKEVGFPGGQRYMDFNGAPNLVVLWDGSIIEGSTKRTTLYAQDRWRVGPVTLEPGLRLNILRGVVPDRGTVYSTNSLSPRFGVAWDVANDHKTVVRGHYGLFHQRLFTGTFDFMDTARQTPQITARVLGPNTFQELTRVTPAVNLGIDDDLDPPYLEQYTVGVERELFADFSVQGQYIRRNFKNILAMVDTGSRYEPVQRQDSGPDLLPNTADDGAVLTVFNLLNPGEAFFLMTNPSEAFRNYDGVQLIAKKRYSQNWQLTGSYTWSHARGNANTNQGDSAGFGGGTNQNGVFANPNTAINSVGRVTHDWTHQVKLEGTYRIPLWGGVQVNGVYFYISGAPWGRTVQVRGLSQGNATIRVEPRGTREAEALSELDLRIEKLFTRGSRTFGVYADVFNATNSSNPAARFPPGVVEASGANYGLPSNWTPPRTVQLGVRYSF